MSFCINCGRELPPEAEFCPKCGTQVEVSICPACGKEVDFDSDFCYYCGESLKEEPASEPETTKAVQEPIPQSPTPAAPQGKSKGQEPRYWEWAYKRAASRWMRQHVQVNVEVDDRRIRCTDTRNLRLPKAIEEEIPLKDISKITLAARASFWCWMAFAFALAVMVAVLFLPAMGIPLAVSEGEMVLILALAGLFLAIELWWFRFNTYHHRLVISGTGDSGEKEIVLEALKPDVLRELQTELTQRTGIQPQGSGDTATTKAAFGAIIGVLLAIAIFVLVANQNPNSSLASSTSSSNSFSSTTKTTTKSTPTPEPDYGYDAVSKRLGYDLDELFGTWEETNYDYYLDMNAFITIENNEITDKIDVQYVLPRSNEYTGQLSIDDEDDLFVDMTSAYGSGSIRFYLFYDGYGISALECYEDGSTDSLYFERY